MRRMSARLELEKAAIRPAQRHREGPTPRDQRPPPGKATGRPAFLPARLKLELQDLADAAKQTASDYLRAVLARQPLGERFFREWQVALAKTNARGRPGMSPTSSSSR